MRARSSHRGGLRRTGPAPAAWSAVSAPITSPCAPTHRANRALASYWSRELVGASGSAGAEVPAPMEQAHVLVGDPLRTGRGTASAAG